MHLLDFEHSKEYLISFYSNSSKSSIKDEYERYLGYNLIETAQYGHMEVTLMNFWGFSQKHLNKLKTREIFQSSNIHDLSTPQMLVGIKN